MKRIFFIVIFLISQYMQSQFQPVTITGSQVRQITSKVIKGQQYELQILLPSGYDKSNKTYPVVYLMDSQWDFPLVSAIYGEQYYDGFVPEIIIVGITWGGTKPNPDLLRARDYTPTKEERNSNSGGADKFLEAIKTEIFPFMKSNYKIDETNNTLMGCSLGGLFTLYTLFTHSELFSNYVAASPAIGWDNEVLYKFEKEYYQKKSNRHSKLYLTMGDVERNVPNFEKFTSHLQLRQYSSLDIRYKILENTGHSGTKSETYARGLQYVFERPDLKIEDSILNEYVGTYYHNSGDEIELKVENFQLTAYHQKSKFALKAASSSHFYSKSEFLHLEFDAKHPKIVNINYAGTMLVFSKK